MQIIACSNCMQVLACFCHFAAAFNRDLRDAAACLDCVADLYTLSVIGCMAAQIKREVDADAVPVAAYGAVPAAGNAADLPTAKQVS